MSLWIVSMSGFRMKQDSVSETRQHASGQKQARDHGRSDSSSLNTLTCSAQSVLQRERQRH